ncbi:hypothetical protein MGSAQ_000286, partial [marine sediment metagenome]
QMPATMEAGTIYGYCVGSHGINRLSFKGMVYL